MSELSPKNIIAIVFRVIVIYCFLTEHIPSSQKISPFLFDEKPVTSNHHNITSAKCTKHTYQISQHTYLAEIILDHTKNL